MQKHLKKAALAFAIAFLALNISFLQPQLHNSYLRWEVGESAVQVWTSASGGGSGFAVEAASGQNFIATNKHVCQSAEKGWVRIVSTQGVNAWKRIVYMDNKHDICLVEGDKRLSTLEIASSPKVGDLHYIVGYPGLRPLTISKGEYVGFHNVNIPEFIDRKEQCDGEVYELNPMERMMYGYQYACFRTFLSYSSSAVAYGGNSGSPVVNSLGNVIGILFAGPRDQEHVSYIVPAYELKRVLSKF